VVPIQIRHRFEVAMQHYDDLGTCLYLDLLERELRDGRRVVLESEHFVAFRPFASAAPHETWLMPRRHQASFGYAADEALDDLAPLLRSVLAGLSGVLGDPDYNALLQSAPVGDEHVELLHLAHPHRPARGDTRRVRTRHRHGREPHVPGGHRQRPAECDRQERARGVIPRGRGVT
jgi:galactose-1-phosphate uridylyltransferase